jgi:hypothetical protein
MQSNRSVSMAAWAMVRLSRRIARNRPAHAAIGSILPTPAAYVPKAQQIAFIGCAPHVGHE